MKRLNSLDLSKNGKWRAILKVIQVISMTLRNTKIKNDPQWHLCPIISLCQLENFKLIPVIKRVIFPMNRPDKGNTDPKDSLKSDREVLMAVPAT